MGTSSLCVKMGLLNMIRRMKANKSEYRILILGLDAAGKTTILKALAEEDVSQVTPTEGFNIKTVAKNGIKLNVWDLGGQAMIRKYWDQYYENTDAIIFVVDSADRERVAETASELNQLLAHPKLAGAPLLVFANKQDLEDAVEANEISTHLSLDKIDDRALNIQACSALNNFGLNEGLQWVIEAVEKRKGV
eukprot:GDKJ01042942.1.p1 GENE.GDKJ01042942.1~~GDKJ01042942.1.p1  ORF type:complete len:192 (-),score=49.93 GDKJ01042942.1:63-638(-)